jgi:curli biogenesis system outer membrane secretion channel CsgG
MMKRLILCVMSLITALVLVTPMSSWADTRALKRRVAVFDFEDKSGYSHHWWSGGTVGEGMADMLTTALVQTDRYRVLERQEIQNLIKEQNLGASGAVTAESAAQIGKLLGVELAVFGSVSEFGHSKSNVGGTLKKKGFGLGLKSQSATVAVDVRFVDTSTGEVVAAETVRKSESKRGISVQTREFGFDNRRQFDESIIGKATRQAIDDIVDMVNSSSTSLPWRAKIIKGDGPIYINAGANDGVEVGDTFVVFRPGEELIDPDTGISLGSTESKVGVIKVTNNGIGNGKAAQCKAVSGSGFTRNDIVRPQ